jgi:plastocyanin
MPGTSLVWWSLLIAVIAAACGGSSNTGTPSAPSPSPGPASSTISILGERGSQSFSPNPASTAQGQTLSWRNDDSQVHRIVFNDESLDTGDISPNSTSSPRAMPTNGSRYHCSIHPTMVGSINRSTGEPPPCTGAYCDSE